MCCYCMLLQYILTPFALAFLFQHMDPFLTSASHLAVRLQIVRQLRNSGFAVGSVLVLAETLRFSVWATKSLPLVILNVSLYLLNNSCFYAWTRHLEMFRCICLKIFNNLHDITMKFIAQYLWYKTKPCLFNKNPTQKDGSASSSTVSGTSWKENKTTKQIIVMWYFQVWFTLYNTVYIVYTTCHNIII